MLQKTVTSVLLDSVSATHVGDRPPQWRGLCGGLRPTASEGLSRTAHTEQNVAKDPVPVEGGPSPRSFEIWAQPSRDVRCSL